MNKKIAAFGGGPWISYLLKGLKNFPVNITAVITASDNGRSTWGLRKKFNTPAAGDIKKVITSLSRIDEPIKKMMEYRHNTSSKLDGHTLGNLILTAMLDLNGSQKDSVPIDHKRLKEIDVELIEDDLIIIEDNILRHNSLKLRSLIFSYLIR